MMKCLGMMVCGGYDWEDRKLLQTGTGKTGVNPFAKIFAKTAPLGLGTDAASKVEVPNESLPPITGGTRIRKSCYFDGTVRWGVQQFTTYNHMLLPTIFQSPRAEYETVTKDVCLIDVAAQRQVELEGPDALKLAEMMTPRSLSSMKVGEALYVIMTDEGGMVINDPVVLKVAEDRFWFSIADADILLWAKGIAINSQLNVRISEASVSPCSLVGPKSVPLLQELFGEWVGELKFFHFRETSLDGIPMLLSRSGWSKERAYELFLLDESRGDELWERLMQAGKKYGIKPGVPNQLRRIEGGMLSFGADMTGHNNALELGLPSRMVDLQKPSGFIGQKSLQRIANEGGPQRRIVGLELQTDQPVTTVMRRPWDVKDMAGTCVGKATSFCFSPMFNTNLAIATLSIEMTVPGSKVSLVMPDGTHCQAVVSKLPFPPRKPEQ